MEPNPPSQVKTLLILHFALLLGQVFFLIIAAFLVYSGSFPAEMGKYAGELILAAALLEIIAVIIARIVFKKKLKKINNEMFTLSQKMEKYRGANITRWAILEAAALLTIIFFLLTNQWLILVIAAALLFIFFTTRPTAPNIASDLQVTETDILGLE
jgi:hypothetical protein